MANSVPEHTIYITLQRKVRTWTSLFFHTNEQTSGLLFFLVNVLSTSLFVLNPFHRAGASFALFF